MYYVNDLNNIALNTYFSLSFSRQGPACQAMGIASGIQGTENRALILLRNPT